MRSFIGTLAVALALGAATTVLAAEPAKATQNKPGVLRLGAVCGGPTAVTIFREIRHYLAQHGLKADYTLYSNYDALVKALHEGQVDVAWNTPLAHAKFHVLAGDSQALVMRDTDVDYRIKLIVRKDANIADLNDLAGKAMVFGSRDSAEATVLPVYFLRKEGVNFDLVKRVSLHDEVDAKGTPCHSPQHVWKALLDGRGQAGVISEDRWAKLKADQPAEADQFKEIWTSPPFGHCVWTARKDFDKKTAARFTQLLTAMDGKDPLTSEVLALEHCKKWVPGSQDGFTLLVEVLKSMPPLAGVTQK